MNKATVRTAMMAVIILAIGCSKDSGPATLPEESKTPLNVTAGIEALARAHDTVWDDEDAIGIFMFDEGTNVISEGTVNRKYVTKEGDGNFNPGSASTDQTIFFPLSGKTDLIAYYPWQSITDEDAGGYLYTVDVSNQVNQKEIDLMTAEKVTGKDKDHKDVAFRFTHQLVKIFLSSIVPGEGLTTDELKGLTVKLTGQRTQGTYDVVRSGVGVVTVPTAPMTDIPLLVASGSQSAEAIVLPAASTAGMELVFKLQSGKEYRWVVSNASQSSGFLAAHKYSYKITIGKKYMDVTSSITDWVTGNGEGESGTAQ